MRLRPLTEKIPKPLLPLAGKPLLSYHLTSLEQAGVSEILINTHHLSEQVDDFIVEYSKTMPHLKIISTYEPQLLGSAGTLISNKDFFGREEILVVYGDNLTNINYKRFINRHRETRGLGTIAVYYEEHPETKGVVDFDTNLCVNNFLEKPKPEQITSNYANAGIYLFRSEIFRFLPANIQLPFDFGQHFFPYLLSRGQMFNVYPMEEFLLDIGTPENYNKANQVAEKLFGRE